MQRFALFGHGLGGIVDVWGGGGKGGFRSGSDQACPAERSWYRVRQQRLSFRGKGERDVEGELVEWVLKGRMMVVPLSRSDIVFL